MSDLLKENMECNNENPEIVENIKQSKDSVIKKKKSGCTCKKTNCLKKYC